MFRQRTDVVTGIRMHADKVPMVPNFGQQPRFIITIQPPGTHFNPPAAMTMPNVDGLAPGQKTEMYSFDHDLGAFVSIGPATVSEDGTVVRSDPGVGVVKGGWHCGGNPSTTGSAGDCPDCRKCEGSQCVPDSSTEGTDCKIPDNPATGVCRNGDCVCPVPVNFRLESASQIANGGLFFTYRWDSSSGHLEDIQKCYVRENVVYSGISDPPFSSAAYFNPYPPFYVQGHVGFLTDTHSNSYTKPYKPWVMTATQRYEYVCACANKAEPILLRGPLTISRTITQKPDGTFALSLTKEGEINFVDPLP